MKMEMKQHQKRKTQLMSFKPGTLAPSSSLVRDVRALIEHARGYVARSVDTTLAALYWQVGKRIQTEILKGKRADYGDNIVQTLSALLTWSHFVDLIYIKDNLKRNFYAEMCCIENWDVRTLRAKIDGMLFERTALSRKPEKVIRHELKKLKATNQLTPDLAFRDPYFLDFLGLRGAYQEKDLEQAILREMEFFILELGVGFAFLERQKRISLDGKDFYIDLLFFHRGLNRLVAIELKLHEFRPADKGQMELYLRWLEKYEKKPNEDDPIGLILCAGKSDEQIELLQLGKSGIRVAEYMTELPSRKILEKKLHQAIKLARARLKE